MSTDVSDVSDISDKSRSVTTVLGVLLGVFGAHRFYVGKVNTGALMAVTLGGLGLWWLYDLILIVAGEWRDVDGRRVVAWDPASGHAAYAALPPAAAEELDAMRREMAELQERVDFAERMLAQRKRTPE